ncbi:hypothetical protein [Pseudofrankia sp. BMG5.37]|uniref:hypothetical protein n=1 Tax=Pseudofrankia sp. BMG5.37 TaxID=3050035 RepID=UPI0028950E32|nr:hypothetical protein [Pseudofrankia sp. BMG5.37]MDT3446045.1 hypothetical protein [Pseudofrankia sp. BMG5.37]
MMVDFRAYGQLVDRTGQPAAGVGMVVTKREVGSLRALGSTVSDSNGAFFIPLEQPAADPGSHYELRLSVNDDPISLPDLAEIREVLWGPHTFVVDHQPPPGREGVAPRHPLVVPEKDLVAAWKLTPGLFTRPTAARAANPCSPYAPVDLPSRVFYLNQLAFFTDTSGDRQAAPVLAPIDFSAPPTASLGATLRYAALLEFRQDWWDYGQALGDLLYSLPLAPCEETKIASVDWRRRDYASQETALDENHFQDSTIARDQVVDETVRLISTKDADSSAVAGGLGLTIGPFSAGVSGALSGMHEAIDATTTASRAVNDRIHQVSNTVRTTRSFTVAEVTQEEESVVRTRAIRNHNHCHTVTFQYYEVLRIHLLTTKVERIRPVVLVPFTPMDFDEATLASYGYLLRRALLDTTLGRVFDAYLGVATPGASEAPPEAPGLGRTPKPPAAVVTGLRAYFSSTTNSIGSSDLDLMVDEERLGLTVTHVAGNRDRYAATATVTAATPPRAIGDIDRVGFAAGPGLTRASLLLDDVVVEAEADGAWHQILFVESFQIEAGRVVVRQITARGGKPTPAAAATSPDLSRLLAHLNANRVYYSAAVIGGGDAGLRFLSLAGHTDGHGDALSDIVDNVVVGTAGNYVAFPLRALSHLPVRYREGLEETRLYGPGEPHERLITLPTPGVFAESQLGACSACEKIDDTRFWDWQTSPCPDGAPDITADMLASRFQDPSPLVQVVRSDLEPKPVQIPELPEPMIKIGDETLKELVKGLQLPDAKGLLDLVSGLAKVSSDHSLEVFKEIWGAYTRKPGGPGSGENVASDPPATPTGAEGGAGLAPVNGV